ncbi:MAG: CAP domain-containing protein [Acidimicrobiales bacterium]
MSVRRSLAMIGAAGAMMLASTGTAYAAPSSPMNDAEANEMLRLVNVARSTPRQCGAQGFGPAAALAMNGALALSAQWHSDDLANGAPFGHTGSDGSAPWDRMLAAGYTWSAAAENVAAGYSSVKAVVDGWLKSPGHCANIMNPALTEFGAARAYNGGSKYRYYWTQDFGAR